MKKAVPSTPPQKIRPSERIIPVKVKVLKSARRKTINQPQPAVNTAREKVQASVRKIPRQDAIKARGRKSLMWAGFSITLAMIVIIGIYSIKYDLNRPSPSSTWWNQFKDSIVTWWDDARQGWQNVRGQTKNINTRELEFQTLENQVFPEFTNQTHNQ